MGVRHLRRFRPQPPVPVAPTNGASADNTPTIPAGFAGQEHVAPALSLHPELEVPIPRRGLTRGLFALIQIMYLCFYLAALFRLREVQRIADSFLPAWGAITLTVAVVITAGVGIPLRCYLLSAVGFDYQRLDEKFRRIFPFVLALDQLWAIAPFLLA